LNTPYTSESDSPDKGLLKTDNEDQEEDEALEKEERRKKARLRTRGPYRKAHADW
jgi:hypothetical protein